jgi:hypothetical protein
VSVRGDGRGASRGLEADELKKATSWASIDLAGYVDGTVKIPEPAFWARTNDRCLIYRGKTHYFIGESESGKTWAAFAAGHRPCALCRREDYVRFGEVWRSLHPGQIGADAIDAQLHFHLSLLRYLRLFRVRLGWN